MLGTAAGPSSLRSRDEGAGNQARGEWRGRWRLAVRAAFTRGIEARRIITLRCTHTLERIVSMKIDYRVPGLAHEGFKTLGK